MNKKPDWLRVRANSGKVNEEVMNLLRSLDLHTVCEEAGCPNCGECFGQKTATFMILGNSCTRNCTFCSVRKGKPQTPDPLEPLHIAKAVQKLELKYVVITSVTRDDLTDGGASHFVGVIEAIRKEIPINTPEIEVLIPDFNGDKKSLLQVIAAHPDVINHNVETVPRLYGEVRAMADYKRSLNLLSTVKDTDPTRWTKSGIMVGLGETPKEVRQVFVDLRKHGCDILTIGQYLPPSPKHHPLIEYVTPEQFDQYREQAHKAGIRYVASGPLVRSSYKAHEILDTAKKDQVCNQGSGSAQ
jgi:lipoyl synthase